MLNNSLVGSLQNYLVMTSYAERLMVAMRHAGVKTAPLARAIGLSYQGVKKVLDGGSTSFSAANNAAAAVYLGVNPSWLANGKGSMLDNDRPAPASAAQAQDQNGLSQMAIELGRLFDLPPNDRIIRAGANLAASEAILRILQERPAGLPTPTPTPPIAASSETRIS